jgi:HSP20 family protein
MANITHYATQPAGVMPLSEAVDRLFREAFTWPGLFNNGISSATGVRFNSNLYETGESYIMQVMVPGVKADELEITAHDNVLSLRGKTEVTVPEGAQSIWVGLGGREFREEVTLPGEVDAEKATADYKDGILTLTLPKAEHARVKTIKVGGYAPTAIEGQKA